MSCCEENLILCCVPHVFILHLESLSIQKCRELELLFIWYDLCLLNEENLIPGDMPSLELQVIIIDIMMILILSNTGGLFLGMACPYWIVATFPNLRDLLLNFLCTCCSPECSSIPSTRYTWRGFIQAQLRESKVKQQTII